MLVSPSRTSTFYVTIALSLRISNAMCTSSRTKHCWQNYVDYYKCVNAKGEDFRPCRQVLSNSSILDMPLVFSNVFDSSTTPSALSAPRPGPTAGTVSAVRIIRSSAHGSYGYTNIAIPKEAGNFPAHLDK